MYIKQTDESHLNQVKDLWNACFDDGPEFTNWFFSNRYSHKNTLAVYNRMGKIESALQLLPYNIFLQGKSTKVSYVVGVSTWPQYRGRGHAKNLLYAALDRVREMGEYISILLPFNYEFYRKYGWEICYEHIQYNAELDKFSLDIYENLLTDIREVKVEDIRLLNRCYKKFMSNYNGYIIRTDEDWKRMLKDISIDGGKAYILQCEDDLGYILFTYRNNKVHVLELIYTDKNIKNALLHFASKSTGNPEIVWTAPPDDMTYMDMVDARNTMYRQPFVMGRIVDVQRALSSIHLKSSPKMEFVMRVHDKFYEFNDRAYLIYYNGDTVNTTTNGYKESHIELDINTLTQLFWGYLKVDDGARDGRILYKNPRHLDMLKEIFKESIPMIYEDY